LYKQLNQANKPNNGTSKEKNPVNTKK